MIKVQTTLVAGPRNQSKSLKNKYNSESGPAGRFRRFGSGRHRVATEELICSLVKKRWLAASAPTTPGPNGAMLR
jgi:hypothetical protein